MEIDHNDRNDPDKIARYNIGRQRAILLQEKAQPFAIQNLENEQLCSYVLELSEDDLVRGMPSTTRFEYLCGKRNKDGEYEVFAYIWFDSLESVKTYATSHGMRVLGGWN